MHLSCMRAKTTGGDTLIGAIILFVLCHGKLHVSADAEHMLLA